MLGWHFAAKDRQLRYDDGRLVEKGVTHKVEGKPVLCKHGLHASKRIIDALKYAPGSVLCRVRLGGEIVHDNDKSCATERTYLEVIDAEPLLREFSRQCAREVINLWDAPTVVRDYLATGDAKLRAAAVAAARTAAWDAARAAAWDAAGATAWDAAWAAARAAAWDAAWAAARAAAGATAWDAAWDAARAGQNALLERMAMKAMGLKAPPKRKRRARVSP